MWRYRAAKGINAPNAANRQIGTRSQLGIMVEDAAREPISEAMVAILGHHPPKYTITVVTTPVTTAPP